MELLESLKSIPIDLGQANQRTTTKGKLIALEMIGHGPGKVLDVGCREGYWTRVLESRGFSVVSIDIECRYERCQQVDANRPLPFPSDTFDRIWCSEVIEHLASPIAVLREFRRVLKPSGFAVLTTPNSRFWLYDLLRLFGKSPKDVQNKGHLHFFGVDDVRAFGPAGGVVRGFFPYFVVRWQITRCLDLLTPTFVFRIDKTGPSSPRE